MISNVERSSPDRSIRQSMWREFVNRAANLSRDEFEDKFGNLAEETDRDVQIQALIALIAAQPWRPESPEKNWFFSPFQRVYSRHKAAVVGICDREHIRDVQALLILSRTLSKDKYSDTVFSQVSLHDPDWAFMQTNRPKAIYFVGRPTMFRNCPIFGHSRSMRFNLPDDNKRWRSRPVTLASAAKFHHIRQDRLGMTPLHYCARDQAGRRRDYAIVQRFRARYGGKPVTFIILAGATSLGTVAASQWVTADDFETTLALSRAQVMRREPTDDTEFESLLEITAKMPRPAAPWVVENIKPLKIFFNDSFNALQAPEILTVKLKNHKTQSVLVDGDDVRFRGVAYDQLLAICEHLPAATARRVDIRVFQSHPAFRQNNSQLPTLDQVETALRDNLKKYRFRESLTIEQGQLILGCKVKFR